MVVKVILGMTISIDGYINDRNGSVEALCPDLAPLQETEPLRDSMRNTGADVMGSNSLTMADDPDTIADSYKSQVPIFVLTHEPPQSDNPIESRPGYVHRQGMPG